MKILPLVDVVDPPHFRFLFLVFFYLLVILINLAYWLLRKVEFGSPPELAPVVLSHGSLQKSSPIFCQLRFFFVSEMAPSNSHPLDLR